MRILVAEDERDLNMLICRKLRSQGYSVDSCLDGQEALDALSAADYDGAVLDIMMPGADGFEVLSFLRSRGKMTPVLFLTARDSVSDRVKGLDSGANDYLVKPFSFEELMARIRSMTRPCFGMAGNVLKAGDLTLDTASHKVARGRKEISLTPREYKLLEYLMTSGNSPEEAEEKSRVIEGIAADVIDVLNEQGLTRAVCTDLEKHAYSVNDSIQDAGLRNMHILAAGA